MRLTRTVALLIAAICLATTLAAAPRAWRDTSGRSVSAEFLYADSEKVYLKLATGKITEVAIGRLSNKDLEFIQKWQKPRAKQGILFEAPLLYETFRSKTFTAAEAQKAGYFPIQSDPSEGVLRVEFLRYGEAPEARGRLVLRLHTAKGAEAGTSSTVRVYHNRKFVGSATGVPPDSIIDIPLPHSVLTGNPGIQLTVKGGTDAVHIENEKTGRGPRLLQIKKRDP